MIRKNSEYKIDLKEKMFDGKGTIKLEHLWSGDEIQANNRVVARLTIQPQESIGFHEHVDEEEIIYIISGQGETSDNGEIVIVNPGDSTMTPAGKKHSMKCISKEPLVILIIISKY